MEEERLQCSLPRVQVSRQLASTPIDCPEELRYEELEERVVPGGLLGTVSTVIKKTAGWGC